jgi:hypothetical protein
VNDIETAGAEGEVEGNDVDDNLVALAHLSQQCRVRPGGTALLTHPDEERIGRDDHAAA